MTNRSVAASYATVVPGEKRSLRQPKGLFILVATETWERFSYYGMQALLIFYLTQHFLLSDQQALAIFGSYLALVHASPMIGGFVADRWLGLRKAVVLGGILLMVGHFGMAFEGHAAAEQIGAGGVRSILRDDFALQIMYLSIALIALGTGLLKPNITAALSRLYEDEDPRRDAGFTYFFLGINIGGGGAALIIGWLGQAIGWRYGFGAAGIGMLIGLTIFLLGQRHLGDRLEPPNPTSLRTNIIGPLSLERAIHLGLAASVLMAWQLVQLRAVMTVVALLVGAAVAAWLLRLMLFHTSLVERRRLMVVLIFMAFNIVFWVAVHQAASSMSLFIDREVDRTIAGIEIQASQFLFLSTMFVLLFAPVVGRMSVRLSVAGRAPGMAAKFALGMVVNASGFVALGMAAASSASGAVSVWWIVLAYALNSAGEVLVAPTGLAMVTKLAPQRIVGTMIGVWFLMIAGAGLIASAIAGSIIPDPLQLAGGLVAYERLFLGIAAALATTGLTLAMIRRFLENPRDGV